MPPIFFADLELGLGQLWIGLSQFSVLGRKTMVLGNDSFARQYYIAEKWSNLNSAIRAEHPLDCGFLSSREIKWPLQLPVILDELLHFTGEVYPFDN